jgi:hypothetical protein
VAAARRHAGRGGDLIESLVHPGDRDQLSPEHLLIPGLELGIPVDAPAKVPFDLSVHVGSRSAHEPFDDLRLRQRPAETRQNLGLGADRQSFAIDQDPVAIEDDQVEPAHSSSTSTTELSNPSSSTVVAPERRDAK